MDKSPKDYDELPEIFNLIVDPPEKVDVIDNDTGQVFSKFTFELEKTMAAMRETAAYRQYIESEANIILNGPDLPLRQPIGLFDPDTMRFRE